VMQIRNKEEFFLKKETKNFWFLLPVSRCLPSLDSSAGAEGNIF